MRFGASSLTMLIACLRFCNLIDLITIVVLIVPLRDLLRFSEASFNSFLLTMTLLIFNDLLELIPLLHYRLPLAFKYLYVVPEFLNVICQSFNKPSRLDDNV
jgi:hypothetical protein